MPILTLPLRTPRLTLRDFVADDLAAHTLVRALPKAPLAHDYFRLLFRADDPRRVVYEGLAKTLCEVPLR